MSDIFCIFVGYLGCSIFCPWWYWSLPNPPRLPGFALPLSALSRFESCNPITWLESKSGHPRIGINKSMKKHDLKWPKIAFLFTTSFNVNQLQVSSWLICFVFEIDIDRHPAGRMQKLSGLLPLSVCGPRRLSFSGSGNVRIKHLRFRI